MQISSQDEQTIVSGLLADQLALHGLLTKIRDLGLCLISVRRLDADEAEPPRRDRPEHALRASRVGQITPGRRPGPKPESLPANLEKDMSEFSAAHGGSSPVEVTGLTVAVEEVITASPELVWDLLADVTRVGEWSPECIRVSWLGKPGRPQPGAMFTGHNRFPNGFEWDVTCMVTEANRPGVFAWAVLDDSGDPSCPSSTWQYKIDPIPGGASQIRHRFTQGPGASYLREVTAVAPDRASSFIAARLGWLADNMRVTLRGAKAAAESSRRSGTDLP